MTRVGPSIVVSATIPRSPEIVWGYLADLEGHPGWMADIVHLDFEGDTKRGPGTRMVVKTRVGPFRTDDVLEVVAWDEGHSITVAHRGAVTGVGRLSVAPDGSGSLVRWEEDLEFPWWLGGRIGALIVRPILRRVWHANLQRLASLIQD